MSEKVSQRTKECYTRRFWFMRELANKVGDDFLVCSEKLAYAFMWELCERIQEELTYIDLVQPDRLAQIYALIERCPYATDEEIRGMSKELYNV